MVEDLSAALASGLVEGAVFALLAAGLTLIWRVQRHVDVALAEQAGFAALALHVLQVVLELPQALAAVLAIALSVVLALAVERWVVRPLGGARPAAVPLVTAAVALVLIGVTGLVTGGGWVRTPPVAPGALPGLPLGVQDLLVLASLLVGGAGLWLLSRSIVGTTLAATGSDPEAARLSGIAPGPAAAVAWGTAGALAGLAGAAFAPLVDLAPAAFSLFALVPALAAATAAGGSLAGAVGGGLLLGCVGRVLSVGLPVAVPAPAVVVSFVLLWGLLLVAPRRLAVRDG